MPLPNSPAAARHSSKPSAANPRLCFVVRRHKRSLVSSACRVSLRMHTQVCAARHAQQSSLSHYQFNSCSRSIYAGHLLVSLEKISQNIFYRRNPTILISQTTYTPAGELASLRYPSGLTVDYARNTSGQISGITTKIGSAAAQPFVQNLSYTALEQPKAWSWAHCNAASVAIAPCTSASRSFDADGRMTSSNIASYQYDAASRITAITQNLIAQRSVSSAPTTGTSTATITTTQRYTQPISWTVGYDNRDRITSFARIFSGSGQQAASSESFTYDPNSNRLSSISINATDTDKDGLYETAEQRKNTTRLLSIQPTSNKLQGFTQTLTTITGTKTNSTVASQINYTLDANGNLTSDGLREFQYDGADRLSKVILGSTFVGTDTIAGNELAQHSYLHNAAGQRVFKSEPKTEATAPNEATLGTGFVSWLQTNFSWLWATAQTNATLGNSYLYADGQLPSWALLGEYGNGGANSTGRTEYIWLPTANGQAIPVGMLRSGKLTAIHTDHLGTPRLMVDNTNTPVWQWAYSAFGDNAPTGILKPTTNAASAFVSTPAGSNGNTSVTLLATSSPVQINNLRFPGQFADSETGFFYNYFRSYQPDQGAYSQMDPKGLAAGWNRRVYVEGNPLSYTDPTGLDRYYDPAWGGGAGQGWWWNMPRQNDTPYAPPGFQPPPSVTLPWPGNGAPPANAEYRGWRPETPRDQDQIVTRAMCTAMAAGLEIGFPYSTPASQACAAMVNKIPRNTCPGGDTFHGAP